MGTRSDDAPTLEVRELFTAEKEADLEAARRWALPFGSDIRAAWADCPRGDWLLRIASAAKVDPALYRRAGLLVAAAALDLAPAAREVIAADLETVLAGKRGRASDAAAERLSTRAAHEASRLAGLQGDPRSPERDERRRLSLAFRSLLRAGEGSNVWPTAADLARGVAKETAAVRLEDFDRECAARVRSVISAKCLPASLARPPTAPAPDPCYVEVRFPSAKHWEVLAQIWDLAGSMKASETLDADAEVWTQLVHGEPLGTVRDVIHALGNGEYDMRPAALVASTIGRLPFDPWAFPYGGVGCMCALAEALGCEVLAHDDGTGRRAKGVEWP